MPSWLAALAFTVLAALSLVAFWVIHSGVDRQDQELLREQTSHAVLLLQQNVAHTSLLLGSVGVGPKVFDANANALRTRPAITVVLVTKGQVVDSSGDVAPGAPRVKLAVGSALHPGEVLTGDLARIAVRARSILSASPVIRVAGSPSVVFSIVPPSIGLPGYVALEVMPISPAQPSPTNGPYPKLDLALYATPNPRPAELIASTIGRKALPHPTASAELRVGNLTWAAVGAARQPLLDSATQATPWIVLGLGLVLAAGLAITVDTLMRRQREQRTVAETLQAALLPETLPKLGGTEAAVRYLPGVEGIHVGGDWYDLIAVDDRHLLAVVGDVSGRGLQAASVMATLLYGTRAYAAEGCAPEAILGKLSRLVTVDGTGHFATCLLILIDVEGQTITVVNGGHPPPLLLHDHEAEYVTAQIGLPVGVSPAPTYAPVTVPVLPGTTLLAFTDGLIERRGEPWEVGLGRLRQAAMSNGDASLEGLLSAVVGSLVGKGVADDTVLLGIAWGDRTRSTDLPGA
jgi:hypothetical protein